MTTQRHVDASISPMGLSCHNQERVNATWTQFKERVEKLFYEKYPLQCGANFEEAAVLVAKFADLMKDSFGDKEGADTARSKMIGDFETFQYGRQADFVVKDENSQAG